MTKKSRLRLRLRHAMYRMARFPLAGFALKGVYDFTARAVTTIMRRDPAVISIYLRRGCAKGEAQPGISDVDMGFVIRADETQEKNIKRRYQMLRRFFPLLDPSLEAFQERDVPEIHRHCASLRFRFEEGRTDFLRLSGPPYFEQLAPLPKSIWLDALRNESNFWWATYAEHVLSGEAEATDPLLNAAQCVKSISESLRIRCSLLTGVLPATRRGGLLWALEQGTDDDREIAELSLTLLDHRYTGLTSDFPERTFAFLVGHAEWLHQALAARELETDPRQLTQAIDDVPEERPDPLSAAGATPRLSTLLGVGEPLYVLRSRLSLKDVQEQMHSARAVLGKEAPLFFRQGDLLFRVGSKRVPCRGRAILHPLMNPETFAAEFPLTRARWTECLETTFIHWARQLYWQQERDLARGELPGTLWRECFVKMVQLEAIRRSALRGEVVYPLTFPAVARAADREGIELPASLRPLFSTDTRERASVREIDYAKIELLWV